MRRRPSGGVHHDGRQDTKGVSLGRPSARPNSSGAKYVQPVDGHRRAAGGAEDLDPQRVPAILQGSCPEHVAGLEDRAVRVDGGDQPAIDDDPRLATCRADGAGPGDRSTIERVRHRGAASLRPMRSAIQIRRVVHERPGAAVVDRRGRVRQGSGDHPVRRPPVAGLAVAVDRTDPVAHVMR